MKKLLFTITSFARKILPKRLTKLVFVLRKATPEKVRSLQLTYRLTSIEVKKIKDRVRFFSNGTAIQSFVYHFTPASKGLWGGTFFKTHGSGDINVIINAPYYCFPALQRRRQQNWLFHLEPTDYVKKLRYDDAKVLGLCDRIYTCAPYLYERGGRFIASAPYVPWLVGQSAYSPNLKYGYITYDYIARARPSEKMVNFACVASGLADIPGHILRAKFISSLCESDCDLELWGVDYWKRFRQYKGRTTTKWEIYKNVKYVLVIENASQPYYWSEKFADAILCYAMPIYYGCTNLDLYFPKNSYYKLDITKKDALGELRDVLRSRFYEDNIHNILKARELILTKHNLFAFIDEELHGSSKANG